MTEVGLYRCWMCGRLFIHAGGAETARCPDCGSWCVTFKRDLTPRGGGPSRS